MYKTTTYVNCSKHVGKKGERKETSDYRRKRARKCLFCPPRIVENISKNKEGKKFERKKKGK